MNNFKVRYSYGESGSDNTLGANWIYLQDYGNWKNFQTGAPGTTKPNQPTIYEGAIPNVNAQLSLLERK